MPPISVSTFVRCPNPHPLLKRGDRWLLQPLVDLGLELARRHPAVLLTVYTDGPPTIVTDILRSDIIAAIYHVRTVAARRRPGQPPTRYAWAVACDGHAYEEIP